MHVFARTKFQPPRPRANLITRERLQQSVRHALATIRLVFVSAPAGAGKTTLVATVLSAGANLTVWVALDADNKLLRFPALLIHAFAQSLLASGDRARHMLEGLDDTDVADRPHRVPYSVFCL